MEWASEFPSSALENGFSVQDTYEKAWELTEKRIDDFWGLNFDFWPLVMLHLHQPDYSHHHLDEIDKEDYQRLDEFAGKVLDRFGEDRTILFMSDHGFPDDDAHNKNAFYSCNRAIFGDKTPQITDFHDKIIELVEE